MGVVKLTSSKRAVQFITDEGVIYQTSLLYVDKLLKGEIKSDFILLSRLLNSVSPDRFKKSPVYGEVNTVVDSSKVVADSLSTKVKEETKQRNIYNTDVIL